jgi:hypothetical protein
VGFVVVVFMNILFCYQVKQDAIKKNTIRVLVRELIHGKTRILIPEPLLA